jgi:hypothetical protein
MLDECQNCAGTGECPVCFDDDYDCSWCRDGACSDCDGTGLDRYQCEWVE